MTPDVWRELIAEAALAPSVHNVQPARWRVTGQRVELFEDLGVRLDAADPEGHDAAISLGAAYEGLALAASGRGLALKYRNSDAVEAGPLRPVITVEVGGTCERDPLAEHVAGRKSWRGSFVHGADGDRIAAGGLEGDDCHIFAETSDKDELADLLTVASLHFIRDGAFRRELMRWMRLNRKHPRWSLDGLNAEALHMSRMEAMGVPLVLGPVFPMLDRLSLAGSLLSEKAKMRSAAAIAVFHRPVDEAPFESGRHFYRLWLRFEAAGFGAAVLAALADHQPSADRMRRMACLAADRRPVSAFRIGRRPHGADVGRARRGLDEILL